MYDLFLLLYSPMKYQPTFSKYPCFQVLPAKEIALCNENTLYLSLSPNLSHFLKHLHEWSIMVKSMPNLFLLLFFFIFVVAGIGVLQVSLSANTKGSSFIWFVLVGSMYQESVFLSQKGKKKNGALSYITHGAQRFFGPSK